MADTGKLSMCVFCAFLVVAFAPATLKTIDNPGGGKIVYGQVDGATTEPAAMGSILRSLHNQYGDRPQVGRFFQVRGTNSVAVFFTLVKHTQGDAHVAGMLIVSKTGADSVEAALVSNDAARLGSTINPMLKALFAVWHPGGESASNPASAAAAAQLRTIPLQDNSASVGLPEGWNVTPQSGMGTIIAQGPNGEVVALGYPFLAIDLRNPRVAQTQAWAQGAGRNTVYGRTLYYPYGADLGRTFVELNAMVRQKSGLQPPSIQIANETPAPSTAGSRCAHLTGQIDANDGKGPREMNLVFCQGPLAPGGTYMNLAYYTSVPLPYADKERRTMGSILASFNVNQAVVSAQAGAIAKPAIDAIHEIGRRAAQQAADAHAIEDAHNRSVEARWDAQDKHNQAFSNYLLDQTVIQDNETNGHATVWNQTADALVRSNPQRYEYVETPNYLKGIDY
ncbi:MAG: hypothetical protein JO340_19615 [Acidobacteriaceae bacterium]|nr:hypothetical protein [Acidobacteriaceae bacterium]